MTPGASHSTRVPWVTLGISAFLTVSFLVALGSGGPDLRVILSVLAVVAIAAYATMIHPVSIFAGLVIVVGFVPYVDVAGTTIPVVLVLAVGVWIALLFMPDVEFRPGWCEAWILMLAATALLSLVATGLSPRSLIEYSAWLAATAVVVPVRFLPGASRTTVARVFVLSTAAASVVGIALILIDPGGTFLSRLAFVGQDPDISNLQVVPGSDTLTVRLTGTLVNSNTGALILAAGLILAVAYFSGRSRVVLVVVIGCALTMTLSRSALATVVVAGILLTIRTSGHRRVVVLASGMAAGLGALAVPGVLARLRDSFGSSDMGSVARLRALQAFPRTMEDHWTWGLGWAREEFREPALAVNNVANAPLLTLYRGGIVLGVLAVAALVVLVARSWTTSSRSFEDAVVCCGVIAFVLVALQLDFLVVIDIPATIVFSLLVGLSLHARSDDERGMSRA
jgi:hypothetical protein